MQRIGCGPSAVRFAPLCRFSGSTLVLPYRLNANSRRCVNLGHLGLDTLSACNWRQYQGESGIYRHAQHNCEQEFFHAISSALPLVQEVDHGTGT